MPLGAYQTNCYILWQEGADTCLVIDPGYSPETVLEKTKELKLKIEAILLTHGHFDHVGAVKALAADTLCKVYICPEELSMPQQFTAGPLHYTHTYGEGSVVQETGISVQVLHTPGHTPGSVCLLAEDVLFSGDTLFAGSCGRTDLPGGDWATICASLERLAKLQDNYTVCPGHGPATELAFEKRTNPYLKGKL